MGQPLTLLVNETLPSLPTKVTHETTPAGSVLLIGDVD